MFSITTTCPPLRHPARSHSPVFLSTRIPGIYPPHAMSSLVPSRFRVKLLSPICLSYCLQQSPLSWSISLHPAIPARTFNYSASTSIVETSVLSYAAHLTATITLYISPGLSHLACRSSPLDGSSNRSRSPPSAKSHRLAVSLVRFTSDRLPLYCSAAVCQSSRPTTMFRAIPCVPPFHFTCNTCVTTLFIAPRSHTPLVTYTPFAPPTVYGVSSVVNV